jgi:hypothetical protein
VPQFDAHPGEIQVPPVPFSGVVALPNLAPARAAARQPRRWGDICDQARVRELEAGDLGVLLTEEGSE